MGRVWTEVHTLATVCMLCAWNVCAVPCHAMLCYVCACACVCTCCACVLCVYMLCACDVHAVRAACVLLCLLAATPASAAARSAAGRCCIPDIIITSPKIETLTTMTGGVLPAAVWRWRESGENGSITPAEPHASPRPAPVETRDPIEYYLVCPYVPVRFETHGDPLTLQYCRVPVM